VTERLVAAVDLGASSGRVMLARVGRDVLELDEVHRFPNEPVRLPDGLHWDALRLFREVLVGLREAAHRSAGIASVGVDTWGVDFALLDGDGSLVGEPFHYRDGRGGRAVEAVHAEVAPGELYARTGLQFLPFNTIYQLAAARGTPMLGAARSMVLMPDLFAFWLSGMVATEATNASTTGLFDIRGRGWDLALIERLGLPATIFGPIRSAGEILGPLNDSVQAETGLGPDARVVLVGSHDTASAVVGVPAEPDRAFAYIACGTWGLVGVELADPILTDESRAANFTNELGVDGRIRYLRNVMGLWLLQESIRIWERDGERIDLAALLAAAEALPAGGPTVDPSDPAFLAPDDMPAAIVAVCAAGSERIPGTCPEIVRCILDSLALAFARSVRDAETLSGRRVDMIHLVGGGARNELLCRLTADAAGLTVLAGPVEATALGNVLVQARAAGAIEGNLEALRDLVRSTQDIRRYEPRGSLRPGTLARGA
jgi:rhamnulokinase